jgi:hypothetical protein
MRGAGATRVVRLIVNRHRRNQCTKVDEAGAVSGVSDEYLNARLLGSVLVML